MKKFFYRVKKGDSVLSLSSKFFIPTGDIIYLNNLTSEIEEGDMLYLISDEKHCYKVLPTDTANSIAEKFKLNKDDLLYANRLAYVFFGEVVKI